MIELNGTPYRLCLLDTNAVSELGKHAELLERFQFWCYSKAPFYISCFSPFTLLELRRRMSVYDKFVEAFSNLPCMALKGYEQFLAEEVRHYPDPGAVEPIMTAFVGARSLAGYQLDNWLSASFSDESVIEQERLWNQGQATIVDGIIEQVANFPPSGSSYTSAEIREFVELATLDQLGRRHFAFFESELAAGRPVDVDAFPSLKATAFTVFYKFYADRTRVPSYSDAFDIIISTAAPYVDAIVTENHQAEALRKTARQDSFIRDLRVLTVRDLRQLPSASTGS